MKKILLLCGIFALGFFVHALVFPDLFSRTPNLESDKAKLLGDKTTASNEPIKSLTIVTFKNNSFHPSKVWIKKGYYIGIRNDDENSQMWLISTEKTLTTPRGYAFGEQQRAILPNDGTYEVFNKNAPEASLVIAVGE